MTAAAEGVGLGVMVCREGVRCSVRLAYASFTSKTLPRTRKKEKGAGTIHRYIFTVFCSISSTVPSSALSLG